MGWHKHDWSDPALTNRKPRGLSYVRYDACCRHSTCDVATLPSAVLVFKARSSVCFTVNRPLQVVCMSPVSHARMQTYHILYPVCNSHRRGRPEVALIRLLAGDSQRCFARCSKRRKRCDSAILLRKWDLIFCTQGLCLRSYQVRRSWASML